MSTTKTNFIDFGWHCGLSFWNFKYDGLPKRGFELPLLRVGWGEDYSWVEPEDIFTPIKDL